MNDGITFGTIISGFIVTWGWLLKITYKLARAEEKIDIILDGLNKREEEW